MTKPRSPEALFEIAVQNMPDIEPEIVPGSYRWNVIDGLQGQDNLGIELGVAAGGFSKRMLDSGRFARFWGVDTYNDHHNTDQYRQALRHVGLNRNYHLLRMTFADALDLFPDNHFDFVYVDGYAHSGEEGGRTMLDWCAKVKPGGILAGDDYDPLRWPLVVWAVHHLAAQLAVPLRVTENVVPGSYNSFASWFLTKPLLPQARPLQPDLLLQQIGAEERLAMANYRASGGKGSARAGLKDTPPTES